MSVIRKALEAALREMSFLNGLRVTDIPDAETTWVLDTRDTADLIDQALKELERKDKEPF